MTNNLKAERTLTAEELQAIIDGCEGVTPGPWRIGRLGDQEMSHVVDFGEPPKAPFMILRNGSPAKPHMGYTGLPDAGVVHSDDGSSPANAAHIARLDPDTIKAMALELQSLRSQSLSTQQPMGEVTDEMVERASKAMDEKFSEAFLDVWPDWDGLARLALNAALHPNQERGE